MDVIDNLVAENRELRDTLIEERNSYYWMQEEDSSVDTAMRGHITHLKNMLLVAYAVIVFLLAVVCSCCFVTPSKSLNVVSIFGHQYCTLCVVGILFPQMWSTRV